MVRFENVGLRYGMGPEVLSDINLRLDSGSFHFLTGPSGAGKSSLLRLMYLALKPSRGVITLLERDVSTLKRSDLASLRRHIGVIFQDFRLIGHLTALENVALPLRIAGMAYGKVRQQVGELLDWVGLQGMHEALPATLSGGQQQRVAIARAVIARPRLLLADEPTGNVDSHIANRLMYLFDELNKMGATIVIATHSEQLIAQFPHPVIRLSEKRAQVTPMPEKTNTSSTAR